MKTILKIIYTVLLFSIAAIPAYSWTLGLGMTSFYSRWEPAFIERYDNIEVDPVLLAGPVVSFQFYDRFMIAGQIIFNPVLFDASYEVPVPSPGDGTASFETVSQRIENEISLLYMITPRLRTFAGYKVIDFAEKELKNIKDNSTADLDIKDWQNQFLLTGLGGGVSYTHPMTENLNTSISTTLLYFTMRHDACEISTNGTDIYSLNAEYKYHGLGNNTLISFTYNFPSINTAISIGVRYQYLKYFSEGNAPKLDYDLNYGLTLSAMYFL